VYINAVDENWALISLFTVILLLQLYFSGEKEIQQWKANIN
jgi:hypothetical protein